MLDRMIRVLVGGPMRFKLWLVLGFLLISCEEQYQKSTKFNPPSAATRSSDLSIDRVLQPTNPTAGDVIGKDELLDPVESQRRQAINVVQPIVWGESMAGISIATTFEESKAILSNPISQGNGLWVYSEYLGVLWSGGVPNTPLVMVAIEGYAGKLELPAPYEFIKTGQNISSYIDTPTDTQTFIRDLSRHLQKEAPAFDCIAQRTCRILSFDDGSTTFDFTNGRITINPDKTVANIFTPLPQTIPARLGGSFDFENQAFSGYTFASTQQGLETQIGTSIDLIRSPITFYRDQSLDNNIEAFTFLYDDLNFGVQWKESGTPELFLARKDFIGDIIVKNTPDRRTVIGASMIPLMEAGNQPDPNTVSDADLINTHAPQLMRDLDTLVYDRAAGYDCQVQNTCKMNVFVDRIELNLNTGTFIISRNPNMNLLLVASNAPRFE